jgi:leader peptidase (prepilin peptidase)/N-methyltransferase
MTEILFTDVTNGSLAVTWVFTGTLFVLGACIGSFLNVVIYRVPTGLSIVSPPSRCPHCETFLRAADNIPIVSWLLLRGRCRNCAAPISARYPLVEFSTAVIFARISWLAIQQQTVEAFLYFSGITWLGLALRLSAVSCLVVVGCWNWDRTPVPLRFAWCVAAIGAAHVLATAHPVDRLWAIGLATFLAASVCFVEGRFGQRTDWWSALTVGALGGMLVDRSFIGLIVLVATLVHFVISVPGLRRHTIVSRLTWPVLTIGGILIAVMQSEWFPRSFVNPSVEMIGTTLFVVSLSLLTQIMARRQSVNQSTST